MLNFNNPIPITNEELELLKLKVDVFIPTYLIEFLTEYSNSVPTINGNVFEFIVVHEDGYKQINYIEKIIGIAGILAEFEDRETLNLFVKHFGLSKDFVEIQYLCPFAYPPNGVLYCAVGGLHNGKIYFADNGDFGILYVTDSFDKFWSATL